MEFAGRITGISRDLVTGKMVVTLESSSAPLQDLREAAELDDLDITIKKRRKKRSLDANAYYWLLLTKLAKIHGWTNQEAHNRTLRRYGQFERVDGQLIAVPLPDTDRTETEVLGKVEFHLMPLPKTTEVKGETFRIYVMLRGSHTYDTAEMARLIEGLIEDCRDSGMKDSDIMTPFEKQKLFEQYGIGSGEEGKGGAEDPERSLTRTGQGAR